MVDDADVLVLAALDAYVEALKADAGPMWERLLLGHTAAQVARYRAEFLAAPPTPKLGFPRREDPWPVWAVTLLGEQVDKEFLGAVEAPQIIEIGGADEDVQPYSQTEVQTVGVFTYSKNAHTTRMQAKLAKRIIFASIAFFETAGIVSFQLQNRTELQPDPDYLPEDLWVRQATWRFDTSAEVGLQAVNLITPPVLIGRVDQTLAGGVAGRGVYVSAQDAED